MNFFVDLHGQINDSATKHLRTVINFWRHHRTKMAKSDLKNKICEWFYKIMPQLPVWGHLKRLAVSKISR